MIKKHVRKWIACALSLTLALGMVTSTSLASSKLKIEKTSYEGKGKVEVEFNHDVQYGSVKVSVKDSSGKSYTAKILDKDDDEIEFKIQKYRTGKTYQFTIKNVKKEGAKSYTSLSGSVKIPASTKVVVEKVDYDRTDREVEFEFKGSVTWHSPKVTITDSNGKNYVKKITDKDDDEIQVKVKKLTYGKTYHYSISGVKNKGASKYKTITGTFKAIDR